MADLFSLLTQSQPKIATGQALLIVDLQNDFILPHGKLPIPDADNNFVTKVGNLATNFRGQGDVIWVRSVFKSERTVNDASGQGDSVIVDAPRRNSNNSSSIASRKNDAGISKASSPLSQIESRVLKRPSGARVLGALQRAKASNGLNDEEGIFNNSAIAQPEISHDTDPELFLSKNAAQRSGHVELNGSDFIDRVRDTYQSSKDIKIVKSYYSAFTETALLLTLRAKFTTQLYVCGCFANLSVHATVLDAVRHGFEIYLIEDCLVSRSKSRHDEAKRQMVDLLGAATVLSDSFIEKTCKRRSLDANGSASGIKNEPKADRKDESVYTEELQGLMQKVNLGERNDGNVIPYDQNKEIVPNMAITSHNIDKKQEEQRMSLDSEHIRDSCISKIRFDERSIPAADSQRETRAEVIGKGERCTRAPNDQKQNMNTKAVATEPVKEKNIDEPPTSDAKVESEINQRNSKILQACSNSQISDKLANMIQNVNMSDRALGASSKDRFGEGDSSILFDLISSTITDPTEPTKCLSDTVFSRLYHEVQWQKMFHVQGEVPRLVAVQGEIGEDGSMPVYRHPSDQSPPLLHFSPTVQLIRDILEKKINQPVNHVLIQLYRSGNDYISEHSDKTLDIVRGSSILNVSFGAQRTMRLRTKKLLKEKQEKENIPDRITQRVPMPHNSMFVLGERTNACWLHSITQDKRAPRDRTEAEKAYEGSRISLTFRHVGTFLDSSSEHIWGQGATSKSSERKSNVVNGNEDLAQKMINAFGTENRSSIFDWEATYGAGFDVLHFYTNPPHLPMLFLSGNSLDDLAALICIKELKLSIELIEPPSMTASSTSSTDSITSLPSRLSEPIASQKLTLLTASDHRKVCYRDNDVHHTEVVGMQTILLYLDRYHHLDEALRSSKDNTLSCSRSCTALAYAYFSTANNHNKGTFNSNNSQLLTSSDFSESNKNNDKEKEEEDNRDGKGEGNPEVFNLLHTWECKMKDGRSFAAGSSFTIADCALWPRLHYLLYIRGGNTQSKKVKGEDYSFLRAYHDRLAERASIKGLVREEEAEEAEEEMTAAATTTTTTTTENPVS